MFIHYWFQQMLQETVCRHMAKAGRTLPDGTPNDPRSKTLSWASPYLMKTISTCNEWLLKKTTTHKSTLSAFLNLSPGSKIKLARYLERIECKSHTLVFLFNSTFAPGSREQRQQEPYSTNMTKHPWHRHYQDGVHPSYLISGRVFVDGN